MSRQVSTLISEPERELPFPRSQFGCEYAASELQHMGDQRVPVVTASERLSGLLVAGHETLCGARRVQ